MADQASVQAQISPDHILQIGMGFWASKTLLSAVELGVFTQLVSGSKTGPELEKALGLHPRGTYDLPRYVAFAWFSEPRRIRPDGSLQQHAIDRVFSRSQ